MSALQLNGVWFSYAANAVVRDVSFAVQAGETVALLGHNGAGKTTLTRLIVGLLHPTRGEILVAGVPNMGQAPEEIARDAAYVFQHPDQQLFSRSVIEEVSFGPLQLGRTDVDARDIAFHALLDLGIESHAGVHPYDLPPAERKLVALAAALAQQPRVLILDEPTQGLDRGTRARVCDVVLRSAESGVAVLAVTHDAAFVAECMERALVMRSGEIVADEKARSLVMDDARARTFGLASPPAARLSLALGLEGAPIRARDVALGISRLRGTA